MSEKSNGSDLPPNTLGGSHQHAGDLAHSLVQVAVSHFCRQVVTEQCLEMQAENNL